MQTEEILDLVDDNDVVIGQMPRSEVYARHLSNFRVVNAFIKNQKGQLWIPRRTASKRIFPLGLDFSVGGHVSSGETYEEALKRETREELNIDLTVTPWKFIGALTPKDHGTAAVMRVYEILSDEAPDYNKNDFVEYFWLRPEEYLRRVAAGEKTKEDPPRIVKYFYLS